MVSCIVHIDAAGLPHPRLQEICSSAGQLAARLRQQGVAPALLLQCTGATDAAAALAALQPGAGAAGVHPLLAQPGQFPVALRLALEQLAPSEPASILFVNVADSTSYAEEAAALGCITEHLPASTTTAAQLQAWALQAVASLAASQQAPPALVVGYVMKESRQLALSQQGMLPLLPALPALPAQDDAAGAAARAGPAAGPSAAGQRGMCFAPLDLGSSLQYQLRRCQMVLQKLTDCLRPSAGSGAVAALTTEAAALLAFLEQQQQQHGQQQQGVAVGAAPAAAPSPAAVCLVDPAEALAPIMDRAQLVHHLEAAALAVRKQAIPMRAPASLLLHVLDPGSTPRQLAAAGVALPCIVKPQAACGVAEAHQMAFVLHGSGFADLEVPLPALAQEYVDHGGVVWKVYVAGEQVFWTQRKSSPDLGPLAQRLAADPDADCPAAIGFDSLKSLPTTLPWMHSTPNQAGGGAAAAGPEQCRQQPTEASQHAQQQQQQGGGAPAAPGQEFMRRPTFEAVAAVLRQQLGLTLFGFDLVFDRAAGELVIVDVNYFPSFRGIPEAPAALRAALWDRYTAWMQGHSQHD